MCFSIKIQIFSTTKHIYLLESFTCIPLCKLAVSSIPLKSSIARVYPRLNFWLPLYLFGRNSLTVLNVVGKDYFTLLCPLSV